MSTGMDDSIDQSFHFGSFLEAWTSGRVSMEVPESSLVQVFFARQSNEGINLSGINPTWVEQKYFSNSWEDPRSSYILGKISQI